MNKFQIAENEVIYCLVNNEGVRISKWYSRRRDAEKLLLQYATYLYCKDYRVASFELKELK